ncbi:MAG: arylsulfatase [Planctomycetales bacterium]|nr:arylsulfatase [Planctomycetales bacterium]
MIRITVIATISLALLPLAASPAPAADRPNIVLLYGDDVGYGDLGCYGAKTIPTPNIDRLAAEGQRFTSGYCTSATCTPSRYSLLTGVYAWRRRDTGIAPPNSPALIKPGTPTLPSMMKDAGYRTGIVGKWHLGLGEPPKPEWSGEINPGPLEIGFDESFIMPTTNDRVPCVYVRGHRVVDLDPADPVDVFEKNPDGQPTGVTHRDDLKMDWTHGHNDSIVNGIGRIGFMTGGRSARWNDETMGEVFVNEARDFLVRNHDKPFFLFYSAQQIHVPRVPHPRFVGRTPHGPRGDSVVEFDWCVGQIVAALEELGVADNTLVIITSDNGPVIDDGYRDQAVKRLGNHRPAGPYRGGKYSRFEGGTHVPWVVYWKGRVQPGVSDAMISQIDLPRTLAALAGAEPTSADAAPDSLNLLPALLGETQTGRDFVIEHSGLSQKLAIRKGPWKYIEPARGQAINWDTHMELANSQTPQLYNLNDDPGETTNLSEQQPVVLDELRSLLDSARRGSASVSP